MAYIGASNSVLGRIVELGTESDLEMLQNKKACKKTTGFFILYGSPRRFVRYIIGLTMRPPVPVAALTAAGPDYLTLR